MNVCATICHHLSRFSRTKSPLDHQPDQAPFLHNHAACKVYVGEWHAWQRHESTVLLDGSNAGSMQRQQNEYAMHLLPLTFSFHSGVFHAVHGRSLSVSSNRVSERVLVLYGCLRVRAKGLREAAISREGPTGPGRLQTPSQCVRVSSVRHSRHVTIYKRSSVCSRGGSV